MAVKPKDQLALDEKVVVDAQLEQLLDEREDARAARLDAQRAFDSADAKAKARIETHDIGLDAAIRVGRYRISRTMSEGGHRDFEILPKPQTKIKAVE